MNRKDRIAAQLTPEEIQPALEFVESEAPPNA
jgi:hypothetical protein